MRALAGVASTVMMGGICAIGVGFWRNRPGIVFVGAALILTGYAVGTVRSWA